MGSTLAFDFRNLAQVFPSCSDHPAVPTDGQAGGRAVTPEAGVRRICTEPAREDDKKLRSDGQFRAEISICLK